MPHKLNDYDASDLTIKAKRKDEDDSVAVEQDPMANLKSVLERFGDKDIQFLVHVPSERLEF